MRVQVSRFGWLLIPFLIVADSEYASTQITRYDAGIEFCKKKLKDDPYDFITAISLGEMYTGRARITGSVADYQAAEKAYRESLQRMPDHNIEAKIGLAASLGSQHRFSEADSIAKIALKESPETTMLLAIAGDVAFDLGKYERAAESYQFYAKQKPGLASWSRVAKMEMLNANWEAAGKLWEKCCALPVSSDPEPSAWAWVMRGELHLVRGNFDEALSCYEHALTIMPGFALALEHKAEIKLIKNNTDEAISLYRNAISSSRDPGLWIFLGDAFERAGRHDSAAAAWKKGETAYQKLLDKGNIGYLRPLALVYLNHKMKPAKALELAKKDLSIRQDFGAYLTLGRAYHQLGKKKEALEAVQKAGTIAENDPQFCYYAGEISLANGDTRRAYKLFTQAIRLCPVFDRVYHADLLVKISSLGKNQTSNN